MFFTYYVGFLHVLTIGKILLMDKHTKMNNTDLKLDIGDRKFVLSAL